MDTPNTKVVIIDDEADGRNIIALHLERLFPSLTLAGQADSVAGGLHLVRQTEPGLVFLDVEMPDGNAFDLLAACRGMQAQFILVTAYDQYALQAIRASVLDYLLKPVNKEELVQAVHKALQRQGAPGYPDLDMLMTSMHRRLKIRKIRIPTLQGFTLVNADDIVRCEAAGNYTVLLLTDRSRIVASRPLGDYESELKDYGFARIHHKHLVNLSQVIEYNKGKNGGGYVTLQGREILEVSARKKAALLQAFGQ